MNDVCTFDCLKFYPGSTSCYKPLQYKGVVSATAFVMHNKYRDTEKYASGCLRLADHVEKLLPQFILRIFADASLLVSPDWTRTIEILKKKPYVQLVYFKCPTYFDTEHNEHFGVYGTLIRMLPMFEDPSLPNWVTVPAGIPVFFTDIDFQTNLNTIAIMHLTRICAETDVFDIGILTPSSSMGNRHKLSVGCLPYPIWAGSYVCKVRFPISLMTDFLAECRRKHPILLPQEEEVAPNPSLFGMGDNKVELSGDSQQVVNLRDLVHDKFFYGVDEFYLAWVFRVHMFISAKKYKIVSALSHYGDKLHQFLLSEIIGSVAIAIENGEEAEERFHTAQELLHDYAAIAVNKADGNQLISFLDTITEPQQLVNKSSMIISLPVAKMILVGMNPLDFVSDRFPSGSAVIEQMARMRAFFVKLADYVIRGKIAMHYVMFQNLLQTIQYLPDGSTSIWKLVTHEIGNGETIELPTDLAIKEAWNAFKYVKGERHTRKRGSDSRRAHTQRARKQSKRARKH